MAPRQITGAVLLSGAEMTDLDALSALVGAIGRLPDTPDKWQGWHLSPVAGGQNNRVVRARRGPDDIAIKWTIPDARRRAYREYHALAALAGSALAAEPLLLDEYAPQPVVVQRWLPAAPLAAPPADDAAWNALINHYAAIHIHTPAQIRQPLLPAMLTAYSWEEGLARIDEQVSSIPAVARPAALLHLTQRLHAIPAPRWPSVAPVLCRVDANWRNFLPLADGWRSVDWENSGWGDPAFELAELTLHPAYTTVPESRWTQVLADYAAISPDRALIQRIAAYHRIMAVWWAARLYRSLVEVAQGGDRRLAPRPADWASTTAAQYDAYMLLANWL